MKNLIEIQQEYMDKVSSGMDRWSHRRDGGHAGRIRAAAFRRARAAFMKLGFSEKQAFSAIRDAHDVMLLERAAVDDELNHAV